MEGHRVTVCEVVVTQVAGGSGERRASGSQGGRPTPSRRDGSEPPRYTQVSSHILFRQSSTGIGVPVYSGWK